MLLQAHLNEYMTTGFSSNNLSPCLHIFFLVTFPFSLFCIPAHACKCATSAFCFIKFIVICTFLSLSLSMWPSLSVLSIIDIEGWGVSPRGAGFIFGADAANKFLSLNKAKMVCRAHQLVMEGYKWHFNEAVLTVWSAPNYCYR